MEKMNKKEIRKLILSLIIFVIALVIIISTVIGIRETVSMDQEQVTYQKAIAPSAELIKVRTLEAEILNSYALLAPDIYRIPISRSMEMMVEEQH